MSYKCFSERLNKGLDSIGVSPLTCERVEIFAKLLKIRKFQAQELIHGIRLPDPQLLDTLAHELEVSSDWLLGKSEYQDRRSH